MTARLFRIWRDRVETRRALERLRSEHLLADIGYTRELAEEELGRWFFQPPLVEAEAKPVIDADANRLPLRERRLVAGLPPLPMPARA